MIKTHLYNTANILIKTQCLIKSNTQISHSQENWTWNASKILNKCGNEVVRGTDKNLRSYVSI